MMKWASAIYQDCSDDTSDFNLALAVDNCAETIKNRMGSLSLDLVVVFLSPHYHEQYGSLSGLLEDKLPNSAWLGCSASGLIGDGQEIELIAEQRPCLSITAAHMPGVEIKPFYVRDEMLPDLDAPQGEWEALIGLSSDSDRANNKDDRPAFIVIPEPFSFRIDSFVRGLDFAYPNSVKIGGLASGVTQPGQDSLFLGNQIYGSGLIGVAISGNVVVECIVAQGCKPVGPSFNITTCKKNLLYELDGEPAVLVLKKVIDGLSDTERELIKDSVFLGVVMDETKDAHHSGDFLIRNILGIEPTSGALVVGELLEEQRTVRFHVRDAASSADDLRLLLKRYKDEALSGGERQAAGALLFSCLGRGQQLYGLKNHDSDCLRNFLGSVPVGGFFCNGEIGPVGNTTFLHGYTSSFGIFREKII